MSVQAHGTTRAELNMHLTPARDGEHLYQLKEGEKVEILKRATTDKNAPKPPPPPSQSAARQAASRSKGQRLPLRQAGRRLQLAARYQRRRSNASSRSASRSPAAAADKPKDAEPPKPVMEDWYLVRNSAGQVGWVLMRMIDLDVPLDVAQYAEGQRIIGYFVLNTVQETIDDQSKQMPQYLVLLNEPKDGLA